MELFEHKPGLLYVVATLLPLASFALLLLTGMLRMALRSQPAGSTGRGLYEFMGGDTPRKWPAFVATGAMALSFVCAVTGFMYLPHSEHALTEVKHEREEVKAALKKLEKERNATGADEEAKLERIEKDKEALHDRLESLEKEEIRLEGEFVGSITWVALTTTHDNPKEEKKAGDESKSHQAEGSKYTYSLGLRDPKTGTRLPDPERGTRLTVGFRIDTLAAIMFLMITLVGTLIHIFSIGYMSDELDRTVVDHQVHVGSHHLHRRGRFGRFFMFLSLFCFAMLNLVLADNLFQVFVSWELVGICSYLLIGFYYERTSASNAANKAFITNRIGDAGFIIGMLILWTYVGTFNFQELFQRVRAPDRASHDAPLMLAGQIVRGDVEAANAAGAFHVNQASGQQALLFPRAKSHFHAEGLDPGQKEVDEGDVIKVHADPQPQQFGSMPYWLLVAAGLGIFLGCVGKSAQFPLHVWLPDAMEGPTPVSALIHAATMVAAGVYLVGRVFPLFTPEAQLVIAYTGAITLFVAATIAVVQTDIKRVLAYSTVSQLGYMMLALGVGGWVAGLFHLITHAFFKALLFLCSGAVIYNCHHEQDMTKMGGLYPKMKITALTMLVGVLTIAGTPFFSGFYSKDAVVAESFAFVRYAGQEQHLLLFLLPLVTAGITTFYMFRMWYLTFTGPPRDEHVYEHAREAPGLMTVPLIVLAIFSVGVAWGWPPWDPDASWLEQQIHHSQPRAVTAEFGVVPGKEPPLAAGVPRNVSQRALAHESHALVGNLTLVIVLLAFAFATLIYYFRKLDPEEAREQVAPVHRFLWNKWYFDELYSAILVRPALRVSYWFRAFDTYVIDGFLNWLGRATVKLSWGSGRVDSRGVDGLVNSLADACYRLGARLRSIQTGYLRSYVLFLVLAAVSIWLLLLMFFHPTAAGRAP